MKLILGCLMVVAGALVGLYIGGYVMLVGGIVDVINAAKSTPVEALPIAKGAAKVLLSGVPGWISAVVLTLPGFAMLSGK